MQEVSGVATRSATVSRKRRAERLKFIKQRHQELVLRPRQRLEREMQSAFLEDEDDLEPDLE